MFALIYTVLNSNEKDDFKEFRNHLSRQGKQYLQRSNILSAFSNYCIDQQKTEDWQSQSQLSQLIHSTEEIILENKNIYLVVQSQIVCQGAFQISEDLRVEPLSVQELLDLRDRCVTSSYADEENFPKLNFQPFHDYIAF